MTAIRSKPAARWLLPDASLVERAEDVTRPAFAVRRDGWSRFPDFVAEA